MLLFLCQIEYYTVFVKCVYRTILGLLSTKILQNNVIIKITIFTMHIFEKYQICDYHYTTYLCRLRKKPNSKILTTRTQTMETFTFVFSCPQDTKVYMYFTIWTCGISKFSLKYSLETSSFSTLSSNVLKAK